MTQEIIDRSAGEMARAVAQGEVSAREVVEASLGRVEAFNPAVNAVCTLNEQALVEAEACDRRLRGGAPARALEGVPVVIKDVVATKGLRTTFGSLLCEHYVPTEDSLCVERLKAAGAIVVGKTNTPEFAHDPVTRNKLFGTTRNPWNLHYTAGGSSGGTAAAVAAGMVPGGIGTDLGGSIRYPATVCGLFGIRPSPGRVAVYPARVGPDDAPELGWDTLTYHVHGPITGTAADCGLLLQVISGPDDRDPSSLPAQDHDYAAAASGAHSIAGRRIAYCSDLNGIVPLDPEVAELTKKAALAFESLGCTVEEACFDTSGIMEIIAPTRSFGMVARYADMVDAHEKRMTPVLVGQVRDGLKSDLRALGRAEKLRTAYWQRLRMLLERYDHLITPTSGAAAFRLDQPLPSKIGGKTVERYYDTLMTTYAFSIAGVPAMSVPCGWNRDGLPVGFQIVGRRFREDMVLEAAATYAAAHSDHVARPVIDVEQMKTLGEDQESAVNTFTRAE